MIPPESPILEAQLEHTVKGEVVAHEEFTPQKDTNKSSCCDGIQSFVQRYDTMFLLLLGTQYFSQGSKVLVGLAASSLFKDTFKLEPGYL